MVNSAGGMYGSTMSLDASMPSAGVDPMQMGAPFVGTDDSFYSIEDLLPTPNESLPGSGIQSMGGNSGGDMMTAGPSTMGFTQLAEPIRSEFLALEDRFSFDPSVEFNNENLIVRCNLSKSGMVD